jgi:hypothetical protein
MCGYLITMERFHAHEGIPFTLLQLRSSLQVSHLLPRHRDPIILPAAMGRLLRSMWQGNHCGESSAWHNSQAGAN